MKATIKFKANKKTPVNNLWLTSKFGTLIWWAQLRKRYIRVKIKPISMKYFSCTPQDQNDWYKIIGTKSGVNTDTNSEYILAWRWKTGVGMSEFTRYRRIGGVMGENKPSDGLKFRLLNNGALIKPTYTLPATFWNGGTCPADREVMYEIEATIDKKY